MGLNQVLHHVLYHQDGNEIIQTKLFIFNTGKENVDGVLQMMYFIPGETYPNRFF
jgi:hypothetical protein